MKFHNAPIPVNPRFPRFGISVYLKYSLAPPPFLLLGVESTAQQCLNGYKNCITKTKLWTSYFYHKEASVVQLPRGLVMPNTV